MKIKQKGLVDNSNIADLVKVATLATNTDIKAQQDKIIKLQHLIQIIFVVKIILKMIVLKII